MLLARSVHVRYNSFSGKDYYGHPVVQAWSYFILKHTVRWSRNWGSFEIFSR